MITLDGLELSYQISECAVEDDVEYCKMHSVITRARFLS